ncbi:MAG: hypothetical protein WC997_17740 [Porticoccaceae bacterium]
MNQNESRGDICIAIDPMGGSQLSLAVAVLLAEKLNTGLYGLLLANDALQSVAQLPFAREIQRVTGDEREFAAETLLSQYQHNLRRIRELMEQSAAPRQVRFRIETPDAYPSFDVILEQQPVLFLPAPAQRRAAHRKSAPEPGTVKWVYDGSEASHHCFDLLRELIAEHAVRKVFLVGRSAVPEQVLTELARLGARVFWMNLSGSDLATQLKVAPEVELILIPRPVSSQLGEPELRAINRASAASVIVVS